MVEIRHANRLDSRPMAELLNQIIATGGTTALTEPVTADDITTLTEKYNAVWHVAEKDGVVLGFQWIKPTDYLPPEATDIATFVQEGQTGLGIGSALFEATKAAARKQGYQWINANIRADNESGLTYYQSRGFRIWQRVEGVVLANGLVVDKIYKRYDLD